MSQIFYQYGYGIVWAVIILCLYLNTVASLKNANKTSPNNYFEVRMVILYSSFGIVVASIVGIVFIPMLMMLLGINWLSSFIVLFTFIIFILGIGSMWKSNMKVSNKIADMKKTQKFKKVFKNPNEELINIKKYIIYYSCVFVFAISYNVFYIMYVFTNKESMGNTYGYDILNLGVLFILTAMLVIFSKGILKDMINKINEKTEQKNK